MFQTEISRGFQPGEDLGKDGWQVGNYERDKKHPLGYNPAQYIALPDRLSRQTLTVYES